MSSNPAVTNDEFLTDVLHGLADSSRKQLPCKYLYDQRGSDLFVDITQQEDYYPTRTELALLDGKMSEIVDLIGPHAQVIEYGSGDGNKTHILLDAVKRPASYVPVDVAEQHLLGAAAALRERYPELVIHPIVGDFHDELEIPHDEPPAKRRLLYFPGSTIGNFTPTEASEFLRRNAALVGRDGAMLLGVDLAKDAEILRRAYNDRAGVTAKFNLNLLTRFNRELDADFDLDAFTHEARFNEEKSRVEMHLVSQADQIVNIAGREIAFAEGETIHTENSYKYGLDDFADLAAAAGWRVSKVWTDSRRYFSVQFLEVA